MLKKLSKKHPEMSDFFEAEMEYLTALKYGVLDIWRSKEQRDRIAGAGE